MLPSPDLERSLRCCSEHQIATAGGSWWQATLRRLQGFAEKMAKKQSFRDHMSHIGQALNLSLPSFPPIYSWKRQISEVKGCDAHGASHVASS